MRPGEREVQMQAYRPIATAPRGAVVKGMEMIGCFASAPTWLAIASAICFALALVLAQRGLRHRGPLAGAMVSVPTTTLLFWVLAPFLLRPADWRSDAAAIFAAVGLCNGAAVLLTYAALAHGPVSLFSPLVATYPLFTLAFARVQGVVVVRSMS